MFEHAIGDVPHPGVAGEGDELLALKVLGAQPVAIRQRVILVHDADRTDMEERFDLERGMLELRHREADIDIGGQHVRSDIGRHVHQHVDLGVFLAEIGQRIGDKRQAEGRAGDDPQLSCAEGAQVLGKAFHVGKRGKEAPDLVIEQPGLIGRDQAAFLALKERQLEVDFQPGEHLAHRGLGDQHPFGRRGDGAGFHELDERLELAVRDAHASVLPELTVVAMR